MSSEWTVEYLETGGPGPRQFAGWYATTHGSDVPPGHGMICTFAGPFETEDEAKTWVRTEKGVEPVEKVDRMRELGRRMAEDRERRVLEAMMGPLSPTEAATTSTGS